MTAKTIEWGEPKTLTATPAGIEIAYYVEPKRAYRVRQFGPGPDAYDRPETEASEWLEVPSVTTVLECLDKPALPWWGMTVGAEGVIDLAKLGVVAMSQDSKLAVNVAGTWAYATKENLVDALNQHKLTVNHTLKKAGDRGQSAHDAFEAWAALGVVPDPSQHSVEERMYVEGLRKFCVDVGDGWETEAQEVAVGSVEHGFAGRYDLRGKFTKDTKLVTRATTLKGEPLKRESDRKYVVVPEGTSCLNDLKTSKGIYPSHLMQLEAYEGAGVECGYEPTDARAVLHVTKDGLYEFKRARATFDDFLAILHTYRTLRSVEEALRA